MNPLKLLRRFIVFLLLTILTQTGGVIYLVNTLLYKTIRQKIKQKWGTRLAATITFVLLYSSINFLIVPVIARALGRVPLPFTTTNHLKPLNRLTYLLNRNYVQRPLREAAYEVAAQMDKKYPGTETNYLDANFPFINGFGLLPHLSHNDGKKLDLAFYYIDNQTSLPSNTAPSFIGYGISEDPATGESNTAEDCGKQGYWQYSMLNNIVPQGNKTRYAFDGQKTKEMVDLFAAQAVIGKIFIEPHLKTRLHLTTSKIRFHGCRAVRHDDHLHVQLR